MTQHKEKMIELLSKGLTFKAIGKIFGVSRQRIHQVTGKTPGFQPLKEDEINAIMQEAKTNKLK
jgi:DNA-directed RNA polymerase sigma subunit (sigma70/sigma32)